MSIQAMAWAIEQQEITDPVQRHVLLALCNYADAFGQSIFPAVGRLERDTGLCRRSVQRALRALREAGVLLHDEPVVVAIRIKRLDRRPNCYRVEMTGRPTVTPSKQRPTGSRGVSQTRTGRLTVTLRGVSQTHNPSSDPSLEPKRGFGEIVSPTEYQRSTGP